MLTATTPSQRYLLAGYYDVSDTSFALLNYETLEIEFFNFPYTYSSEAFSNQVSEEEFNKTVIEAIIKPKKIKLSELEFIAMGFMGNPLPAIEAKMLTKLPDLLQELSGLYPFVVNQYSVMAKDAVLSYQTGLSKKENLDGDEFNELANLSIYPQLIPTDIPTITVLDRRISQKINLVDFSYVSKQNIVFCGSRFSLPSVYQYLDWILALDFIRKPGFYGLNLDRHNAIPLLSLIKKFKPQTDINPTQYLEPLGTLVNSPGETECLLNSDVGTGQFFDVKKENIYVVPMSQDGKETLELKSRLLGNCKEIVTGGKIGLIISTKESKSSIYDNTKLFNDCVKQFSLCLHQY